MRTFKVTVGAKALTGSELLETAVANLGLLEEEVGPDGQTVLLDLIARDREPSERNLERIRDSAGRLLELLRNTRLLLMRAAYTSADTVLDEAVERTDSWLARFLARPDTFRRGAAHGLRRLLVGQRQLKKVEADLRKEIERQQTSAPPEGGPPGPVNGRPPRSARHTGILAEIERLRDTLREGATWDEAVAAYNRAYGTDFNADRVRQWGKRSRRRTRKQLIGAGVASWGDADEGEYGM